MIFRIITPVIIKNPATEKFRRREETSFCKVGPHEPRGSPFPIGPNFDASISPANQVPKNWNQRKTDWRLINKMAATFVHVTKEILKVLVQYFLSNNHLSGSVNMIEQSPRRNWGDYWTIITEPEAKNVRITSSKATGELQEAIGKDFLDNRIFFL